VRNPDGSWQKGTAGNFVRNPALVDTPAKAIADKYRAAVAPLADKVVGSITADISNLADPAGESPLGEVIADGMLRYTGSAQAQFAFMNPGGIRAQLGYGNSPGGEAPGQVTYGECFTVQPFNNLVVTLTYTGAGQGGPGAAVRRARRADRDQVPAGVGRFHGLVRHDEAARPADHQCRPERHADRSRRHVTKLA
jgi:hypothetical protein